MRFACASTGLRELLELGEEKTDEELGEEQEEQAVVLAFLAPEQWEIVVANDAWGKLLETARSGDPSGVWRFLADTSINL